MGVQGKSADGVGLGTVNFVADDGVSQATHVDANLVFASRDQNDFNQ